MSDDRNSKDIAVIVERVGNGYQVRPLSRFGEVVCACDILVFQDKGFVSSARDYQPPEDTLLGWLDQHFTEAKLPPKAIVTGPDARITDERQQLLEACAIAAWSHYMDVCKARGLPPSEHEHWNAARAVRGA